MELEQITAINNALSFLAMIGDSRNVKDEKYDVCRHIKEHTNQLRKAGLPEHIWRHFYDVACLTSNQE